MALPDRRRRRGGDSAAVRLAQAAIIVNAFIELVNRFKDMKYDDIDLESGNRTEAEIEDPEFGYQMYGILKSLLTLLEPVVNPRGFRESGSP